jgi:hypothetical protein
MARRDDCHGRMSDVGYELVVMGPLRSLLRDLEALWPSHAKTDDVDVGIH